MKKLMFILLVSITFVGCIHPKVKFRKAALLDPMMDPSKTSDMSSQMMSMEPTNGVEKGAISGDDGSLGSSCPTCG